jgi:Holliday junction resolvase RusA-like endonuclease
MDEQPTFADIPDSVYPNCIVHFSVHGLNPIPQGSKKAFVVPGTNRAVLTDVNGRVLKPWRELISAAAAEAMGEKEIVPHGPIKVRALFRFVRLKSHFKSDGETLRADAPDWKHTTPDLDKLQRALGDSLTGVVIRDDGQIAHWDVERRYSSVPGVTVWVYAL